MKTNTRRGQRVTSEITENLRRRKLRNYISTETGKWVDCDDTIRTGTQR